MPNIARLVLRLQNVPTGRHRYRDHSRDTMRALDELRAARPHDAGRWSTGTPTAGLGHSAVSHALRSI